MIKATIFDVDNTLYDYDRAHQAAFRQAAAYAEEALGLSEEQFSAMHSEADRRLRLHIGAVNGSIHNRLIRYQLILEQMGKPLVHAPRLAERYWSAFLDAVLPSPGTAACLESLRSAGCTVGVGTNMTADYQFAKLERLDLLDKIDFLVSSEEAGAEKPDGKLFALCAEKAGCLPGECLFVGDNLHMDALGAQQAGLRPVWLCPRDGEAPPPGILRIRSLSELPGLLQSL